jgi:hypothetical protein
MHCATSSATTGSLLCFVCVGLMLTEQGLSSGDADLSLI